MKTFKRLTINFIWRSVHVSFVYIWFNVERLRWLGSFELNYFKNVLESFEYLLDSFKNRPLNSFDNMVDFKRNICLLSFVYSQTCHNDHLWTMTTCQQQPEWIKNDYTANLIFIRAPPQAATFSGLEVGFWYTGLTVRVHKTWAIIWNLRLFIVGKFIVNSLS